MRLHTNRMDALASSFMLIVFDGASSSHLQWLRQVLRRLDNHFDLNPSLLGHSAWDLKMK